MDERHHMYKPHAWARSPRNPNVSIWRYFWLNRFINLIETGESHFARLDQFTDQFEGVLPPGTVALPKDGFTNTPRRPDDELTDFETHVRDVNRIGKLCTFANCWFSSEHESEGMWRLFGSEGVAIQSSYQRLCESFVNEPRSVYVGVMQYFDYRTMQPETYGNTLAIAFNKRIEFEHEREVRAVIVHQPDDWTTGSPPYEEYREQHPQGLKAVTDTGVLIDRVVLAPAISVSSRQQLLEAMEQRGLKKTVVHSVLDELPGLI